MYKFVLGNFLWIVKASKLKNPAHFLFSRGSVL
jgi:hypothetical protein